MCELKKIGVCFANLRKDKGLTQEDLAGILEIERTYLSKLENGKLNIGIKHFILLARELGEDPGELLTNMLKHKL